MDHTVLPANNTTPAMPVPHDHVEYSCEHEEADSGVAVRCVTSNNKSLNDQLFKAARSVFFEAARGLQSAVGAKWRRPREARW